MKYLRTFYIKLSLPAKAALWFALAQFFQKGINMLTTPIFTRIMTTEEYGRVNTFFSWADILIILISLSVWRGIWNVYKTNDDKDAVLSSIISLTCFASLVSFILLLLLFIPLNSLMKCTPILYVSLGLYAFSQNIIYAWIVRMQYEYKYKYIIIYTLVYTTVTAFGGLLALIMINNCAEAKILPQVFSITVFSLLIVFYYLHHNGISINKKIWKFCIGFAVPLLPHYLSEVILHSSDRIMINNMCGYTDVAVYSISYSVGSLSLMVTSAINSAFAPYQYQKINNKEYRLLAKKTNVIIGFVAFCSFMLMMFGREIVLIFGGTKYADSISLIIPITIGVYFNYVFQLFARVQEYYEQKHTIVIASISCAFLNIILNVIFIKNYGYKAAAFTTTFCYFTFCFLHYLFYMKACNKNIGHGIYDVKGLVCISVLLVCGSQVIRFIDLIPIIKYLLLGIIVILVIIFRKRFKIFVQNMRE